MQNQELIYFKNAKNGLSDKEYDFNSGNNKKYHYIGVTKLNSLLAKSLSNRDVYNFF